VGEFSCCSVSFVLYFLPFHYFPPPISVMENPYDKGRDSMMHSSFETLVRVDSPEAFAKVADGKGIDVLQGSIEDQHTTIQEILLKAPQVKQCLTPHAEQAAQQLFNVQRLPGSYDYESRLKDLSTLSAMLDWPGRSRELLQECLRKAESRKTIRRPSLQGHRDGFRGDAATLLEAINADV